MQHVLQQAAQRGAAADSITISWGEKLPADAVAPALLQHGTTLPKARYPRLKQDHFFATVQTMLAGNDGKLSELHGKSAERLGVVSNF